MKRIERAARSLLCSSVGHRRSFGPPPQPPSLALRPAAAPPPAAVPLLLEGRTRVRSARPWRRHFGSPPPPLLLLPLSPSLWPSGPPSHPPPGEANSSTRNAAALLELLPGLGVRGGRRRWGRRCPPRARPKDTEEETLQGIDSGERKRTDGEADGCAGKTPLPAPSSGSMALASEERVRSG
jgi:hypothetical protein